MDLIFDMKELTILLLGAIFVTLIAGSVQSISADHLELGGKGIFKDQDRINFTKTTDSNSKYQIHLQVEIRNAQGQLVSISEASHGKYIPHEITNFVFNEKLGKKEIATIDDIKYEKVQYTNTFDMKQLENPIDSSAGFFGSLDISFCGEISGHGFRCVPIFHIRTTVGIISETDVVTNHWTILRVMN